MLLCPDAGARRERRRKKSGSGSGAAGGGPPKNSVEMQRLQQELQRKLAEQEALKGELYDIRSTSGGQADADLDSPAGRQHHHALDGLRDAATLPQDRGFHLHEDDQWSDTTLNTLSSVNRYLSRPRERGCSEETSSASTVHALPPQEVEDRYRQRLARLEQMVKSDEKRRMEKEATLKHQLAEKEQLLSRFEVELSRAKSVSPRGQPAAQLQLPRPAQPPPSSTKEESKVPLSPAMDSPPKNRLSPNPPSPRHSSEAKPFPLEPFGLRGGRERERAGECMGQIPGTMSAPVSAVSPTPPQQRAFGAGPTRMGLVGKTSPAPPPSSARRNAATEMHSVAGVSTQTDQQDPDSPNTPTATACRSAPSSVVGGHRSGSSGRGSSLRREDYPAGADGDDAWMSQVESVVLGTSAPVTPRSRPVRILSPTRSRRVSFVSPPRQALKVPFSPSPPDPAAAASAVAVAVVEQRRGSPNRTRSPTTPVPDALSPGGSLNVSLQSQPLAPEKGMVVVPAGASQRSLSSGGSSSTERLVSAVCERVLPLASAGKLPSAVQHVDFEKDAKNRELEAKLEHYTLLVEQFEETVLKLSGCVDEKVAEVAGWEKRYNATQLEWEKNLAQTHVEWQQRLDSSLQQLEARSREACAAAEERASAAEKEVHRLQRLLQTLRDDSPSAPAAGDTEAITKLEREFAGIADSLKQGLQESEKAWQAASDRTQADNQRLESDVASLQIVVSERASEARHLSEKISDLTKELESKEAKVQSLRAQTAQLANEVEEKQDAVSSLKLLHAQTVRQGSNEAGAEIREMIVELKHEYMRIYEEKKVKVEQEAKDFYSYCKEELELRDKRLEQARSKAAEDTKVMMARNQAINAEASDLQHKYDATVNTLTTECRQRTHELQRREAVLESLRASSEQQARRLVQVEKALEVALGADTGQPGAAVEAQTVVRLQQEVEAQRRLKQGIEIEMQGEMDRLRRDLHEKELELASLRIASAGASEVQPLREEVAALAARLTETDQTNASLRRELETKSEKLKDTEERMHIEFQKQYIDLQQVQGQFGKYEGEVSVLRAQLSEAQANADRLRVDMDTAHHVCTEVQRERDTLKQCLASQRVSLSPPAADPQDTQRRLLELTAGAESLHQLVEDQSRQLAAAPSLGQPVSMPVSLPDMSAAHPELEEYRRRVQQQNERVLRETESLGTPRSSAALLSMASQPPQEPRPTSPAPAPAPTMWHLMYNNPPNSQYTSGPFQPEDQAAAAVPPQPPAAAFSMPAPSPPQGLGPMQPGQRPPRADPTIMEPLAHGGYPDRGPVLPQPVPHP